MPNPEHVIVLALENRSFDHLLGYLNHPDPTFDGLLKGGPYTNPGWDVGPVVPVSNDAKAVLPVDPDHSHDAVLEQLGVQVPGQQPNMQGFVTSYERKGRNLSPAQFEGLLAPLIRWFKGRSGPPKPDATGRGPLIMRCHDPAQIPVMSTLALQFGVCTRWFCSVPGETWPNRNFLHAATSDGETDIDPRFYQNRTIFESLADAGKTWHIYHDDTPQVWAFNALWDSDAAHENWFEFSQFAEHVAQDKLPAYSFIEPNHKPAFHTLDHAPVVGSADVGNSQHPGNGLVSDSAYDAWTEFNDTDFARGEQLVATIYEALRRNLAVFEKSLLLITYDEHGGTYDHVPPPTDAEPVGEAKSTLTGIMHFLYRRKTPPFDFKMLGPRVPAIVISPFIRPGTVSAEVRDHSSVPATLRTLFAPDQPPLTARDAKAVPFHTLINLDQPRSADLPDLSAHAVAPQPATGAATAAAVAPAPAPAPAAAAQAAGVAAGQAAAANAPAAGAAGADLVMPSSYQDLLTLAGLVGNRLNVSGPVISGVAAWFLPEVEGAVASAAFMAKAAALRAAKLVE